jgi:hypothetical protein
MPALAYIPENDFDAAVEKLLKARIGHLVDNGGQFLFEGSAIDTFSLMVNAPGGFPWDRGAIVLFGAARQTPQATSGTGAPLREAYAIEVLVVVRGRGWPLYRDDVGSLKRLCDKLKFEVFYDRSETGDFFDVAAEVAYVGTARVVFETAGYFARTLQFNIIPKRQRQ